ncbi:FAD binding domain-containing protein [Thelonectria olida]|uniref:FAD binding domain-containing protein n=1 Tax=Thelonectria olida TaxID=1576542 RepID=A0A9P9ADS4_9HYPO|nr:FAD binding domain-containing protein [Thelonectria olida]
MASPSREILHCDVLIVGSGAAGLAAAAAATSSQLNTILIEQHSKLGGTTFRSGGTIWMPANFLMHSAEVKNNHGASDSKDLGAKYILSALEATQRDKNGDRLLSSPRRIQDFLSQGSDMITFLRSRGLRWMDSPSSFPDYHPEFEGAWDLGGRTLDPAIFDAACLGPWAKYLQLESKGPLVARFEDFRLLTRPFASVLDFLQVCWMLLKSKFYSLRYRSPMSMGRSFIAQLLSVCRQRHEHIRIITDAKLTKLLVQDGIVVGGKVKTSDGKLEIQSRFGVLLATAGFARNQEMRDTYLRSGTKIEWSLSVSGGDTGDALRLGERVRAESCLLSEVWGIPTMNDPITGDVIEAMFAISKPFSIVVNNKGTRFFAESSPYGDAVRSMLRQPGGDPRAWLVLDQQYRQRYTLGNLKPWTNTVLVQDGSLLTADSIHDLEDKMGIHNGLLASTIYTWNNMCDDEVDRDYGRGNSNYQRYIGDPNIKGNSTMGKIQKPPFYAIRIFPGDAGTKGGLRTNKKSRVLGLDGKVITGLYAAGNASASVFGRTSLAAGVTLLEAIQGSWAAVNDIKMRSQAEFDVST